MHLRSFPFLCSILRIESLIDKYRVKIKFEKLIQIK